MILCHILGPCVEEVGKLHCGGPRGLGNATGSSEAGMVFRYATGSRQEDIIFFQEQFLGEDLTVSWGMTVLVLKGGSEQRSTASFNRHTCDAALVPSGCGRFQMLIVSLAQSLLTHWKPVNTGHVDLGAVSSG